MKKLAAVLAVVGLVAVSSNAFAAANYDMGPYINASIGGGVFHLDEDFGIVDLSADVNQVVGRVGAGYLYPFSQSENPWFVGGEINGVLVHLFKDGASSDLYGPEAALSIGKVLGSGFALYGRLGGTFLGNHDDDVFEGAPLVGIGLGYQVSQHFRLNVEENNAFFVGVTSVAGSIGLQYTFS